MRILFTEYAKWELEDAVSYYELVHSGLGKRFEVEVKQAVSRIAQYPEAWSVERGEIRKCIMHKFPYKLLYSIEKEHILIIAVAHLHRKPGYWINRRGSNTKM